MQLLLPEIQSNNGYFGFSKAIDKHSFKLQFSQELAKLFELGEISRLNHKYALRFDTTTFTEQ